MSDDVAVIAEIILEAACPDCDEPKKYAAVGAILNIERLKARLEELLGTPVGLAYCPACGLRLVAGGQQYGVNERIEMLKHQLADLERPVVGEGTKL